MKKIVIGIIILLAGGAGVGYYLWNKKPTNVEKVKPSYTLSASDLFKAFSTDSANAKKYIGDESNNQVIQVSGSVSKITITDSTTNVFLATGAEGSYVNCAFAGKQTQIKEGQNINIKGMCSGYNFDADLGIPGDVIMDRCVVVN